MRTIGDEAVRLKEELLALEQTSVRIAVFGQPGAGKSSLVNALVGKPLASVGVHTDTTREAHTYSWNGLHLIDLPGYDTERFPKEAYVKRFEVDKLDLLLCVFDGKLHEADSSLLRLVRNQLGKSTLIVRNKIDVLWQEGKDEATLCEEILADVRSIAGDPTVDVHFVSCRTKRGLDELTLEIERTLSAAKRERWERSAKAYSSEALARKRAACEKYITVAAAAAAANAANPLPGLDLAIDLGILIRLFSEIKTAYGLDGDATRFGTLVPMLMPQITKIVQFATKEGALLLLRRFATSEVTKRVSKYVPFVGPVVAASFGFLVTKKAGDWFLGECHSVAESILAAELARATPPT